MFFAFHSGKQALGFPRPNGGPHPCFVTVKQLRQIFHDVPDENAEGGFRREPFWKVAEAELAKLLPRVDKSAIELVPAGAMGALDAHVRRR